METTYRRETQLDFPGVQKTTTIRHLTVDRDSYTADHRGFIG